MSDWSYSDYVCERFVEVINEERLSKAYANAPAAPVQMLGALFTTTLSLIDESGVAPDKLPLHLRNAYGAIQACMNTMDDVRPYLPGGERFGQSCDGARK